MDIFLFSPGGQLGLWVGISMITLCEILGFLSQLLFSVMASVFNIENNTKQDRKYEEDEDSKP